MVLSIDGSKDSVLQSYFLIRIMGLLLLVCHTGRGARKELGGDIKSSREVQNRLKNNVFGRLRALMVSNVSGSEMILARDCTSSVIHARRCTARPMSLLVQLIGLPET